VLATKVVHKTEARIELLGLDQEPCAVRLPFHWFHCVTLTRMLPFFCKFLDPDPPTWLERNANFFSKSEGDCTSETAAGQFSIFGAVEEKDGQDFPELARTGQRLQDPPLTS
jgi:hypothetical protein